MTRSAPNCPSFDDAAAMAPRVLRIDAPGYPAGLERLRTNGQELATAAGLGATRIRQRAFSQATRHHDRCGGSPVYRRHHWTNPSLRRRWPLVRLWTTPETKNGRPTGLAIQPPSATNEQARLLVADTHYYRMLVYDLNGHFDRRGRNRRNPRSLAR